MKVMMAKSTIMSEVLGLLPGTSLTLLLCVAACAQTAQVRTEESREFEILVSGKPAGTSQTKITQADDGLTTVCTDAAVTLNYIVYKYRYEFHGREVWKGNRLLAVDDRAVDSGKELKVHARVDDRGSVIQANGKS